MKNMKFQRLFLLSTREKKARKEEFNPDVTVVIGENDTGKSCFLKSAYAAFGADAYKVNDKWKESQATLLLQFSINENRFTILRQGNLFSLFDTNENLIWSSSGLVKNVGPQLANLFDFEIQLATKRGDFSIPPPAFCFLPFYVDQDKGWLDTWESFQGLGVISNYKDDIANFHTGIRPKEFYVAKSKRVEAKNFQSDLKAERRALEKASERLSKGRTSLVIGFDPEIFADNITELLAEQNKLQSTYDRIRRKIGGLQSRRAVLVEEIEIAQCALKELELDIQFVGDVSDIEVVCPTCNTVHQNDFANRFGLMGDADACRSFLIDSKETLQKVELEIEAQLSGLGQFEDQIAQIREILEETRGEIKLQDMLQDESERIVDRTISAEQLKIDHSIGEWESVVDKADAEMKVLSSQKRRREIIDFYAGKFRAFAHELDVTDLSEKVLKKIRPIISETGSYQPRVMLAYYFAVLHTIQEYSTSCFCPIILDTPLQQDQDEENAAKMIKFAINRTPDGAQLILGTGSLHGVTFSGNRIETMDKNSLLNEDSFEEVRSFIRPFIDKAFT